MGQQGVLLAGCQESPSGVGQGVGNVSWAQLELVRPWNCGQSRAQYNPVLGTGPTRAGRAAKGPWSPLLLPALCRWRTCCSPNSSP